MFSEGFEKGILDRFFIVGRAITNMVGDSQSEHMGVNTIRGSVIPNTVKALHAIVRAANAVESAAKAWEKKANE